MSGDADRRGAVARSGDRATTWGDRAINTAAVLRNALIGGVVLVVVCALYGILAPASFFRAYLVAFEFWLSVSLGCMVVMMIRHLTGGVWGLYLRPILETGAALIPLTAVFFAPLLIGLTHLYPWYGPAYHNQWAGWGDAQPVWFSLPFFGARAVGYFVIWTALALLLNAGSRGQAVAWSGDHATTLGDHATTPAFEEPPRRFRVISALGIAVYGLTITGAAIDWSMSLMPHFFSTIYGPMYAGGQLLAGFAFAVLAAALLAPDRPPQLFRDFGNLLLAFTMIWAYLAFSQFLLIWAGNLPDETVYYVPRVSDGWQWVALIILLGEFALPFLLLLLKRMKVTPRLLAGVAALSLLMHYIDLVWLTMPSLPGNSWDLLILSPALLIGLGGIWVGVFLWRLQQRPLPTAPGLQVEGLAHE